MVSKGGVMLIFKYLLASAGIDKSAATFDISVQSFSDCVSETNTLELMLG